MKFGFIPSFNADIFQETEFAKKHFSHIEITLREDLSLYSREYIDSLKESFDSFPVLGHIHWGIDFSEGNRVELDKALKSVEIFHEMGAKKITVHPSNWKDRGKLEDFPRLKKNNIGALRSVFDLCKSKNIVLMVENKIRAPFNTAEDFLEITESIPGICITLDTGHAELTSPGEPGNFLKLLNHKIEHIHLHDTFQKYDHLFFESRDKLTGWVNKLINTGYDKTVTLETFEVLKDGVPVCIDPAERNSLLLEQLKFMEEFCSSL